MVTHLNAVTTVTDQEETMTETITEDPLANTEGQVVVDIGPTINPEALIVTDLLKWEVTQEKEETLLYHIVSRKINFNQRLLLRTLTPLRKISMSNTN